MVRQVKIKIFNTWHDAIMEKSSFYSISDRRDKYIRKYHLYKPMDRDSMIAFRENTYNEVECDDGHRSVVYMESELTLIEKDAAGSTGETKKEESDRERILITRRIYDGEADAHFEETYLFDKDHAKAIYTETLPMISDLFFFVFGRKNTVTHTLWLTRNGGFVWEERFSSGNTEYSIIEKSEAEKIIKHSDKEKYIEIFHPKEV